MALIDLERIITAKTAICNEVLTQIRSGAQSDSFADAYACGQFLKVPEKKQHGFHGTAAAIRIIAGYNEQYNEDLRKLINYFDEVEKSVDNGVTKSELEIDKSNIIKNAEILYTLSYVQSGTKNTEVLKEVIYKRLINAKNRDGGWAFFSGVNDDSDIYSTSLVFLALKKHNYNNLADTLAFIKDKIKNYIREGIPDPSTFSKLCFAIYSLIQLDYHKNDKDLKKVLTEANKELWRSPHCVLNNDFEQNIEYPSENKHYYVRIPWQLYLISIANDISPKHFAKKLCISKLNSALFSIIDNRGFVYKQSGKNISTRTYSILFEMLSNIHKTFKPNLQFKFFNALDWVRSFLGSRLFKTGTTIVGVIIILILVINWITSENFNIDSVAPSIIASLLMISITFGKTKYSL